MKFFRSPLGLLAGLLVLASAARAADAPTNSPTTSPATQAPAASVGKSSASPPTATDTAADLVPPIDLLPPSGTPELVPVGGNVTPAEIADLTLAVQTYQKGVDPEDFTTLENFLQKYPQSAYRASVLVNLGELAFHYGYYSKALDYDERAWNLVKALDLPKDPTAQKVISGAGIRLAGLYADLGRRPELEALSIALEHYPKWGADVPLYESGIQSAVIMHNKPTTSYNCGPYALLNMAKARPDLKANQKLFTDAQATPDQGFTVAQVEKLAQDAGLHYAAARRAGDAALPLPAVVHWKAGHYAAVLEEKDGRYHVKDPTFGTDFWMSAKALKYESSGVFIIPIGQNGDLPTGWQAASEDDKRLAGRGVGYAVNYANQSLNTPGCSPGMATVGFNLMRAYPYITDTPIFFPAAYGPPVQFQLSYFAGQNSGTVPPNTASIGSTANTTWTMSYLSSAYVMNTANTSVSILNSDGSTQTYTYVTSYNTTTGNYSGNLNIITGAVVEKQGSGNTTTFIQHFPDGSATTFGNTGDIISVSGGNYYLLTSIADPQGNALTFYYDGSHRLSYVEDVNGIYTNLTYNGSSDYISSIYNGIGDYAANFTYDSDGRLTSITDVEGIVSNFTYSNGTIATMGTPYGNTTISTTTTDLPTEEFGAGAFERTLLIEDPAGNYQRVTFGNPIYGNNTGGNIDIENTTLYFDKHAMSEIGPQLTELNMDTGSDYVLSGNAWLGITDSLYGVSYYQYANQYKWSGNETTATGVLQSSNQTIDLANSTFRYTYYSYNTDSNGLPISSEPSEIFDESSTYQYTYNTLGKATQYTDPAGRVTRFNYESNNIDLASVQRQNGAGNDTLVAYSNYNTSHEPQTITDASGSVTNITYNGSSLLPEVVTQYGTGNTALQTTYYVHNSNGTVDHISRSGGNISNTTLVTFDYSNYGADGCYLYLPTDVITPDGMDRSYVYDSLFRLNSIQYSDGTVAGWNYYSADINGTVAPDSLSLESYTDRFGHTTTYTYDADGHPLTATDDASRETQYDWCDCGGLASITDPAGHVTSFTYDFAGDVLTKNITVNGSPETYSYLYDDDDRLISITLPGGGTPSSRCFYDVEGTGCRANGAFQNP